jgi:type II secretion system protein N
MILLYILFPSGAVKDHIVNKINQENPDVHVAIETLRLAFPPSVELNGVTVELNNDFLFVFDRLKLTPRLHSLLFDEKIFHYRAEAYKGEISGRFSIAENSGDTNLSASGSFSQMRLELIPLVSSHLGDRLSGVLSGNFELDAVQRQPAIVSGTVFITDCNFLMPVSFLNMDRLNFQHVEADFEVNGSSLDILNAEMQGPELTGTVSGSIFFESPMTRSEMDLLISVNPLLSSPLSEINALTFRASETFENPTVSIVSAL